MVEEHGADQGGTWKRYVAADTALDLFTVSLEKRQSERRDKHAHPDSGLRAASSPALSDFFLPVLERPVQLEGQVSSTGLCLVKV